MINREIAAFSVLFLIIGVVILMSMSSSPEKSVAPVQLPDLETSFCSIVEGAGTDYRALMRRYSAAKDAKNGIVQQQLTQQMTSVYKTRNTSLFQILMQADFAFEGWSVSVVKIRSPEDNRVGLDFQPVCSTATVHAYAPADPNSLNLLAALKQGDKIIVSGRFVERWGGKAGSTPGRPVSAEEFEGSFTESGAMDEPEYSALVTQLK
jgi:hypothetical protein